MDFSSLARRALRIGLRRSFDYLSRTLDDEPRRKDTQQSSSDTVSRRRTPRAERTTATGTAEVRKGTRSQQLTASPADFESTRSAPRSRPRQTFPRKPHGGYPGDYRGPIRPIYSPDLDGAADPGEIVWAWVPYEEDYSRGKDRPVLIIGRERGWLLALMLSSQDHIPGGIGDIRDAGEARWINVGSGDWDAQGRPSEIRLDRVIRIADGAVRREGAIMPMTLFSRVVESVQVG